MPTYTVEQVIGEPTDWQGQSGPMKSYKLKVSGEERVVELSQIPKTAAPTVGQVIEGHIEEPKGNFPPKLRKAQQGNWSGGQGGGGMSPEREKRIVRQHSQSMSIETLKLAVDCGINLGANDVAGLVQKVKVLADVYDQDAGV